VDNGVNLDGSDSYDPEGNFFYWEWDFDDGTSDSGYWSPPPSDLLHTYSTWGTYYPTLTVYDDLWQWGSDYCQVHVIELSLTADSGYIAVNDDDDDDNQTADKQESPPTGISNEDNLIAIHLSVDTPNANNCKVQLKDWSPSQYLGAIKVWRYSDKRQQVLPDPNTGSRIVEWPPGDLPSTLHVEGLAATGDTENTQARLALNYVKPDSQLVPPCTAKVYFTVVQIQSVDVDTTVDNDTYKISSVLPSSEVPDDHFVAAQGTGDIWLKVTITPDTENTRNQIGWSGITQDEDPLRAWMASPSSGKYPGTVDLAGRDAKDFTCWVVWSSPSGQLHFVQEPAGIKEEVCDSYTMIWGGYDETHTLSPGTIITQTDRPDLSGVNSNSPPNVPDEDTGVYNKGADLSAGANMRWDASRQIRQKILNPDELDLGKVVSPYFPQYYTSYLNYPSDDTCGNDDPGTIDEDNDPYTEPHKGCVWSIDNPHQNSRHLEGEVGNTWEKRVHFRAFARLNIGGSWYRISDWYLWKVHLKFKKQNESEATWNLDFNGDGDKLDIVPIWRNDGSFNALDNNDF